MNRAFYTGRTGLMAYQGGLDVASHNLVNSGTYGYKGTKSEFRELLNNNMDANKNRELPEGEKLLAGTGVKLANQDLLFTQGALQTTNHPLDFAIAGEGLFAVQTANGIEYTRSGAFNISLEGNNAYLVTPEGGYILDADRNRIPVDYDAGTNTLNEDNLAGRIGVFTFTNPYGLTRADGASFRESELSGPAEVAPGGTYELKQQMLERSNTDVAQTMADVIVLQKAYQLSARVVTTADEVEQVITSLRG